MNMDVPDDFSFNQYGQLVSRRKYVNTTVRNYKNMLSANIDLTIEEVTSAANEQYALLQEEENPEDSNCGSDLYPTSSCNGRPAYNDGDRVRVVVYTGH
jgi:hypothetical protein